MSLSSLINKLAEDHKPRPWWKEPKIFLLLWFFFHLAYFISFIAVTVGFAPQLFISFILGSWLTVITGWYALYLMMTKVKLEHQKYLLILVFSSIGMFSGSIGMNLSFIRPMGFRSSDLNCFLHGISATIIPLLLFPFLIKQFFTPKIYLAGILVSVHLAVMAISAVELTCGSLEYWHLIWGHQTIYLGVFLLMIICYKVLSSFIAR